MPNPLYLVDQDLTLTREGRCLCVNQQGKLIDRVPLVQVSSVVLHGNIEITTPALHLLLREGIDLILLSRRGRYYGRLQGATGGNVQLRVDQVLASRSEAFSLATARSIVRGKILNMRTLLQRYARRDGLRSVPSGELKTIVAKLLEGATQAQSATTLDALLGIEGRAAALYYSAWPRLLKPPWLFSGRKRRPPPDPVNVLLSFGYTLLTQNVKSAVLSAGLDSDIGFLHQIDYNRPSLALDLVEEFRAIIADSTALRCLNNGILEADHFEAGPAQRPVVLTEPGVRRFLREFEARIEQTVVDPATGEQSSYRRLMTTQAYRLARTLSARDPAVVYQPFLTR